MTAKSLDDAGERLNANPESRSYAAAYEMAFTLALAAGIGVAIDLVSPSPGGRGYETQLLVGMVLGLIVLVACGLWRSLAEVTRGGTFFERQQALARVRLDGSPMRWPDWWRRHWPSFVVLAYLGFLLFSPNLPYRFRSVPWMHDRWLGRLWTWWGLAALAVIAWGYVRRERRPTTMLVQRPRPLVRRGFDVIQNEVAEAEVAGPPTSIER